MGNLGFQELLLLLVTVILPVILIVYVFRAIGKSKTSKNSIADELEKLYSLKERGIITQQEFDKRKSKLI